MNKGDAVGSVALGFAVVRERYGTAWLCECGVPVGSSI